MRCEDKSGGTCTKDASCCRGGGGRKGAVLRRAADNVSSWVVNPDEMRCVTNNFDNYPALFVLLLTGQGIPDYQAKTL